MTITRTRTVDRSGLSIGLTLGALGIVFGDIGTSPLYAIRESLGEHYGIGVTEASVLGILSLVFWSLILVISLKYATFVMRADNQGEGGILALTALIRPSGETRRRRYALVLVGLFGTALLYGDGAITPAISVLAAVEGLEVAAPALEPYVIPVAIVILVALFSIQRRGTGAVGAVFGPVMLVWFATLAVLGLIHVAGNPSVFAAVDPRFAFEFFSEQPLRAFLSLGSVFLVVTGGEALYADLGHFGLRPIRFGWYAIALPGLALNYFGQGALLLGDPDAVENPFFLLAPAWARLPLTLLATAATVIASQALISGVFSLTTQAIQLDYVPRLQVDYTSPEEIGQVYLPAANWALMVACVGLVLGFQSSSNLAAAYGVAVTATMLITTILFTLVARERWGWPWWRLGPLIGLFLVVDLAFFGANIIKVPDGGWFPLVAGLGVFAVMTSWRRGRVLLYRTIRHDEVPLEDVVEQLIQNPPERVPGTAVYMFPDPDRTPPALLANLRHNHVLHEDVVVLAVRTLDVPTVPRARRVHLTNLGEGFYQIVLDFGFSEIPDVPAVLEGLIEDVSFDPAYTSYFLGRESVRSTMKESGMARWRERLFAILHRNATSAADHFRLPPGRVIEIGLAVEI